MTPRVQRLAWFAGLYLASVAAVALVALATHLILQVVS